MGEASSPHGSLVTFENRVPALPSRSHVSSSKTPPVADAESIRTYVCDPPAPVRTWNDLNGPSTRVMRRLLGVSPYC